MARHSSPGRVCAPRPGGSVLERDDACDFARVEAAGAFIGEPGTEREITVSVEWAAARGDTATYSLVIDGGAINDASTTHRGGASLAFLAPQAIHAVHELLDRAIVAAERHGILPALPAPRPLRLPRVVCEIDPPDGDPDDHDTPVYTAAVKGAGVAGELSVGTFSEGGFAFFAPTLDALEATARALLAAVRRERTKATTPDDAQEGEA